MRPIAPLGLLLLLSACSSLGDMVGNPFAGIGGFIGDTTSFRTNPNRPVPDSDNARRVMGQDVTSDPVLPEPGNIWPSMARSEPSRVEIERPPAATSAPAATPPASPRQVRPMSSPMVPAPLTPAPAAPPSVAPPSPSATIPPAGSIASGTVVPTAKGGAVITTGNNGIMNFTLPSGSTGRAIDNGNGTMTLIGTDGSVMSVPAPR